MTRPRLLDLCCGAGGAAVGYHRAGFDVVGVDCMPQPRYPFEFHQADALTFPLDEFDAVHASPPCQRFTRAGWRRANINARYPQSRHPDVLTPLRIRLTAAGLPFVIENVPGAPMRVDLELCGSMFGLPIRRHRWFEASWPLSPFTLTHRHEGRIFSIFGHGAGNKTRGQHRGDWGTVAQWRDAMGIDWMVRDELSQAIPPAYTEWVGRQLLAVLTGVAA
jgi:DNA (cytosine-5)-methyltransferase 1